MLARDNHLTVIATSKDYIIVDCCHCRLTALNRNILSAYILSGKKIEITSTAPKIEDTAEDMKVFEDFLFYLYKLNIVERPNYLTWRLRPEYKQGFYISDNKKPRTA